MVKDKTTEAIVEKLIEWLDDPQAYLEKQSRREMLEKMIQGEVNKMRNRESYRAKAKDVILAAALLSAVAALWGYLQGFIG